MLVLKIILGVIMILCGAHILSSPVEAALTVCCMLTAVMLLAGIFAIIAYFEGKNAEKVAKKAGMPVHGKTAVGSLIFGIVAVVIAILSMTSVIGELLMMRLIGTIFGLWVVVDGISRIVCGIQMKRVAFPGWLAIIILGVMLCVAGVFCIVSTFTGILTVGVLFGISIIMAGFALLFA